MKEMRLQPVCLDFVPELLHFLVIVEFYKMFHISENDVDAILASVVAEIKCKFVFYKIVDEFVKSHVRLLSVSKSDKMI